MTAARTQVKLWHRPYRNTPHIINQAHMLAIGDRAYRISYVRGFVKVLSGWVDRTGLGHVLWWQAPMKSHRPGRGAGGVDGSI